MRTALDQGESVCGENGSSTKRGAILESCEKGSGFVKDSELFVLVCEIRER